MNDILKAFGFESVEQLEGVLRENIELLEEDLKESDNDEMKKEISRLLVLNKEVLEMLKETEEE